MGSVKGKLKDNIDDLLQKLSNAGSDKQQQHLEAMVTIADHIVENGPIVKTQHLVEIYKRIKGSTAKCISASQMLHTIGKHLNVAQIYINSKAYIFENPGKEMLDILKCLENINSIDKNTIKIKLEDVIGDDFHVICEYMDSKRDRDTLKAILSQLTSSTFMAKLANVQDKRTLQRAKTQVTRNIQLFKEMKTEMEEHTDLIGESGRKKKYRLLQRMKLDKLRHVFEGRGRMLKCEVSRFVCYSGVCIW